MSAVTDVVKVMVAPVAKAVAGALSVVAMFLIGWVAEMVGVPIDVDPQEVSDWIAVAVLAVVNYGVVWFTKNQAKPEGNG